jgi:CMP-N-acetylneuraminic acid synthetase
MRSGLVLESNTFYGARTIGCPMDPARSVNIDDEQDWARAEALLAANERPSGSHVHADR